MAMGYLTMALGCPMMALKFPTIALRCSHNSSGVPTPQWPWGATTMTLGYYYNDPGVFHSGPGVLHNDPGVLYSGPEVLHNDPGVLHAAPHASVPHVLSPPLFAAST